MADLESHVRECLDVLGHIEKEPMYREINERLDQFAHYPDIAFLRVHRQFLHHREGIAYFRRAYGELGGQVAELHVLTDCGHIPEAADYYTGKLGPFGTKKR